ncbi:MAG: cadherin-like beta sandwich domain-containing protein [bacterium]|nr:cadherin-like beta sandwich domain-containing protein [bacterium]
MKKIKYLIISLITIFAFNINVFAASGNLKVSSSSVYVGDRFTVTANINSAAAWNIHVSASGPVSGCTIKQADVTADAMDTNKKFSATCTATGTGTITIKLSGDVTSALDGNAVNIFDNKTVTVSKKATSNNNNNNQSTDNKSKNNNIKELSVDGYDLIKIDNNNYTLSVSYDVTSININATLEDSKAKVTGVGTKELQVGENNIGVIVTSESGAQNKINIKITRKFGYYLDDLDSVLKNEKLQDADIIINADSMISKEDIDKIKVNKKILRLNYYNEDRKIIYSWIINGKEIKESKNFSTAITFTTENIKEIYKLSNYADGLYINFDHSGDLPTGTKIKLYVGDKFEDGSITKIYHYDNTKKSLINIKNDLKVIDGYVEFDIEHCSEYFLTMSTIENIIKKETSSLTIFMIFTVIELIVIIALVIFIFIKIKPIKKEISNVDFSKNDNNLY